MWEKIKAAWSGWLELSEAGKLVGLLMAIILTFVLLSLIGRKTKDFKVVLSDVGGILSPEESAHGVRLVVYTAAMLILCIFPITAVMLMAYQTKFYDYKWIFSYIPVTLMSSLGVSALINIVWSRSRSKMGIIKAGGASIGILVMIFLCGAGGEAQEETPVVNYQKGVHLVEIIENNTTDNICMWAPAEVVSAIRQSSPGVKLLYGRNMWDKALDAYCYDVYGEEMEQMYYWMENCQSEEMLEESGSFVEKALSLGVNVIVLPRNVFSETEKKTEEITGVFPIETDEYYIFIVENS